MPDPVAVRTPAPTDRASAPGRRLAGPGRRHIVEVVGRSATRPPARAITVARGRRLRRCSPAILGVVAVVILLIVCWSGSLDNYLPGGWSGPTTTLLVGVPSRSARARRCGSQRAAGRRRA